MMEHEDSVLEFALHEVLGHLAPAPGQVVDFDRLRVAWRTTALRHCDLRQAIDQLIESGSLQRRADATVALTGPGAVRAAEVAGHGPATMADQVVRSVLKNLRDRVAPGALQPLSFSARRRHGSARDRAVLSVSQRAG